MVSATRPKCAEIREFYLAIACNSIPTRSVSSTPTRSVFARVSDLARDFVRARDRDLGRDLIRDRDCANIPPNLTSADLARNLTFALDLANDRARTYTSTYARSYAHARAHARDFFARVRNLFALTRNLFALTRHYAVVSKLKELKKQLQEEPFNGQDWRKKLRHIMIEQQDIWRDWSFIESQKQTLQQYYDANKFLVELLKQDGAVSESVRQEIEDNLLLPIITLRERQPEMYE